MDYMEETPRYRKKAKPNTPPKAKHKHYYEPCVFEFNGCQYTKAHGITYDKPSAKIAAYCPVCGKAGTILDVDPDRWERRVEVNTRSMFHKAYGTEPTEECLRELNPETRTLPTFWVDSPYFTKQVQLPVEDGM